MTDPYESAIAGRYLYLWGFHDARREIETPPDLHLENQNPLDHLVGDLFGMIKGENSSDRWFIAEVKKKKAGFHQEISWRSGKDLRKKLINRLIADDECRTLSEKGHFAIWWGTHSNQDTREICTARYAQTAVATRIENDKKCAEQKIGASLFEKGFEYLYEGLRHTDSKPDKQDQSSHAIELGLSQANMRKYLECMAVADEVQNLSGGDLPGLLFGRVTPRKQAKIVITSIKNLLIAANNQVIAKRVEHMPQKVSTTPRKGI